MNLSKEQIRQMREDGDISQQEFFRLLSNLSSGVDTDIEPAAAEDDPTRKAIDRLTVVVEQIGKGLPQESDNIAVLGEALSGIKAQLKALTEATNAATETRKKKWTFTPEYDFDGRIEKMTVE